MQHSSSPLLPPGWASQFDETYQTWFFINLRTQQSQWQLPTSPPALGMSHAETDEEMARRLQAEYEREQDGAREDGGLAHNDPNETSFAAGEPWGQPSHPSNQGEGHHGRYGQGHVAVNNGFIAGTETYAHSAPNSRPRSPHRHPGQEPSYVSSHGDLAPPSHGEDRRRKRASWTAGIGGAAAGKMKNTLLYGSSSGSSWGGGGSHDGEDREKRKKKKKDRKSWGGSDFKDWGTLGKIGGGGGGDDGGGDADDGGGIGEVLGALLGA